MYVPVLLLSHDRRFVGLVNAQKDQSNRILGLGQYVLFKLTLCPSPGCLFIHHRRLGLGKSE